MKNTSFAAFLLALAVGATASFPTFAAPAPAAPPAPAAAAANPDVIINGKVNAVTVYRGQALVTRVVPLPAGAGLGEIVVSDLPERILPNSIFADGDEGVEVRSVIYRQRPVAQDVREEVRRFDDQIQKATDQLAAITKQQQVLQEERTYLEKLANFAAPTATVEMTKGVLNAEQLKTLTTYQFDQRKSIADQELKFAQQQRTTAEELALLQRQRNEVTGRSSRTLREAVIFVGRKAGGTLHFRYLVDSAGWAPSYNIRADSQRKNATIEYQASIQQTSGEDWSDVAMTLSTATPNLVAAAPMLNPLTIALTRTDIEKAKELGAKIDYRAAKGELAQRQQDAELNRSITNTYSGSNTVNGGALITHGNSGSQFFAGNGNSDNDKELNKLADQLQCLELVAKDGRKEEPQDRFAAASEGIVVTYQMRGRTSLPSRADQQLVQIDSLPMKGDFYKVAIPVLTTYVYDQATLTNTSNLVLLAGPIASYAGGQFVGNGMLPTVAVGQPFTVGFGIDSSLRANRERLDKIDQTQGGNKVVSYTYKIAIDNFAAAPATVRIMDRLPTGKDSDVRIVFTDAEKLPLSTDQEYLQTDRKKGILRWDVEVPAQKRGSEAFSLTYKMNMEYDKNLAISAASMLREEDIRSIIDKK